MHSHMQMSEVNEKAETALNDIDKSIDQEGDLARELCFEAHDQQTESKIERLECKLEALKKEHKVLSIELSGDIPTMDNIGLNKVLTEKYDKEMKRHIRQLKKYNELKDLSMVLIQMIADQRQSTLRVIMDEMGIEKDDK